jgi:hypothetical protein
MQANTQKHRRVGGTQQQQAATATANPEPSGSGSEAASRAISLLEMLVAHAGVFAE